MTYLGPGHFCIVLIDEARGEPLIISILKVTDLVNNQSFRACIVEHLVIAYQ